MQFNVEFYYLMVELFVSKWGMIVWILLRLKKKWKNTVNVHKRILSNRNKAFFETVSFCLDELNTSSPLENVFFTKQKKSFHFLNVEIHIQASSHMFLWTSLPSSTNVQMLECWERENFFFYFYEKNKSFSFSVQHSMKKNYQHNLRFENNKSRFNGRFENTGCKTSTHL